MSISTHAGKNNFTLNNKSFQNRGGATPIYDITSTGGGGGGDTKINSIILTGTNTAYVIPDWDPSWRVCVTGMDFVSGPGGGHEMFFTETGYNTSGNPVPWTIALTISSGMNPNLVWLQLNPETGTITQNISNGGFTQAPSVYYGVYSAGTTGGSGGGGMGVHYGVALLNNSNTINILTATMDQLWNDTSQANQDAVLATDPVDPARTYLFAGANLGSLEAMHANYTSPYNNVEQTYKKAYVELQPTPVVAGDVQFAALTSGIANRVAPIVGVGETATGDNQYESGDFAYAVIYRDRLMVVGRSCIQANSWHPPSAGGFVQFKWLTI